MFWNGTNWVDERLQEASKQTTPRRWRRRTLYATIASFLVVAALLIPEWTVQAAGPSLSVDGPSVAGGSMQVSGKSFSANSWVRLRWDSRTSGMAYARATRRGTFSVAMGVPSDALPGSHVITASVYSYSARYRSYRSTDAANIRVYVVRPTTAPTAPGSTA